MLSKMEMLCSLDSTINPRNTWLIATTNKGKISEIQSFFKDQSLGSLVRILSLNDFPDMPFVEETGMTFVENALIKARAYFQYTGIPVLSDDSGLVVPSLDGKPGIYSARYAGVQSSAKENNEKLLRDMLDMTKREAFFACSLVFLLSPSLYITSEGYCHGQIALSPSGKEGFGYDPIFYLPTHGKTMAELSLSEKQEISHRGLALGQIAPILQSIAHENC